MRTRSDYWPVVIFLFNMLVALVVYSEWLAPIRSYMVFGYLLFCPGLSFAYLIPTRDKLTQTFLTIVLSIGINATVAEALLYIGKWSPELILLILITISLVGAASELYIKIRRTAYSISQL